MSTWNDQIEKARKGDDSALADAVSGLLGQLRGVADLLVHQSNANDQNSEAACLIGDLAEDVAEMVEAWFDAKQKYSGGPTQDPEKIAQVTEQVRSILKDASPKPGFVSVEVVTDFIQERWWEVTAAEGAAKCLSKLAEHGDLEGDTVEGTARTIQNSLSELGCKLDVFKDRLLSGEKEVAA